MIKKKNIKWILSVIVVPLILKFTFFRGETEANNNVENNNIDAPAILNSTNSSITINNSTTKVNDKPLAIESGFFNDGDISLLIGNPGDNVYVVDSLTFNWKYKECLSIDTQFPAPGARKAKYVYDVEVSKLDGKKLLDESFFTYPSEETDYFDIKMTYLDYGIYKLWVSLKYKMIGENQENSFTTVPIIIERCNDFDFDTLKESISSVESIKI